jgi:hypothetical protein
MRHMEKNRQQVYLILITGIILAGIVFAFIFFFNVNQDKDVRLLREFEGGTLYREGNIGVLQLRGSYEEMGRQYGGLLKDEIQDFYHTAIDEHYIQDKGLDYGVIKGFSQEAYHRYPAKFRALMSGMSQTSGLSLEQIVILDQILGIQFVMTEEGECSAIAAWGNYTAGKPLLLGRNYDSTVDFREFSPFLNVVVYNPADDIPTAVVAYPGEVTSFTGMNANGVFVEINEGAKSGGTTISEDRLILPVELVRFLLDYPGFGAFDAAMHTTRSNYAFIIQVADTEAAYSYEASVLETKRRAGQEPGLLVATNDFVDPAWGLTPPVDAEDKSVQRRENLLRLGNTYKGRITPGTMMQIMDIPFEEGGATWTNRTAYQVVAEPASNTWWIKIRGIQDWVKIDLDNYFIRKGDLA